MERIVREIAKDLQALAVREGGVLLVHASLKSLGLVPGGPETVIAALLEAIGPRGTLLLPALSYATITLASPVFDARLTPACVGALPEHFRRRPGTLRSLHPTHSVCGRGVLAREILDQHWRDDTPCGPNSPFRRLPDYGGQVLFLGCGLRPNTSMHAVEELVEPPYLFAADRTVYEIIRDDGRRVSKAYRRHGFAGVTQRYDRVAGLVGDGALHVGTVLQAECHLLESGPMWQAALAALAEDPLFFVDQDGAAPGTRGA